MPAPFQHPGKSERETSYQLPAHPQHIHLQHQESGGEVLAFSYQARRFTSGMRGLETRAPSARWIAVFTQAHGNGQVLMHCQLCATAGHTVIARRRAGSTGPDAGAGKAQPLNASFE